MRVGGWDYAGVFVACLVMTLLLTPIARWIAHGRGILDHPGGYKAQASPVPYLGGTAIVVAFAAVVVVAVLVRPPVHGAPIAGTRTKSRSTNCNASRAGNSRVEHAKLFSPRIGRMRDFT